MNMLRYGRKLMKLIPCSRLNKFIISNVALVILNKLIIYSSLISNYLKMNDGSTQLRIIILLYLLSSVITYR